MRFEDFRTPASLAEARDALRELGPAGCLLAGGTSLVFQKGKGRRTAVDITRIGFDRIAVEDGVFRVGANAKIAELQEFSAPGWVLHRVARDCATQQVRNVSTLGGNVARVLPWNDFPVALLVLECTLSVAGDSEREIGGDEFFAENPSRFFKDGDILTSINVKSLPKGEGFGYRKEVRTWADFSLATAAARVELDGTKIKSLRAAVGSCLPFPKRLDKVEKLLKGRAVRPKALKEDLFLEQVREGCAGIAFRGKYGLSDDYAAGLAVVIIRDAIADAVERAMEVSK